MRFVVMLIAVAVLALPGVASAATVSSTGSSVAFQTDLGETNDATLSLSADGSQLDFVERTSNLAAGLGCTAVKTGEVTCPASGVTRVAVELGDNDDHFAIALGAATAPTVGVTGGDGVDLVSYTGATGVSVSLDDTANDGPAGRGDNIQADVEQVSGTDAADNLTGDAAANSFFGGNGADTYQGAAGDDFFDTREPTPAADTVACGDGRDTVDADKLDQVGADCEIVAVNSRVYLTNGPDTFTSFRPGLKVYGRRGNDALTGGPGPDAFSGDRGNDTIRVRGGGRDTVSCGKGRDKVAADPKDKVSKDCERVTRR